jgi:phosphate ABC transporter phosphate-binding protein
VAGIVAIVAILVGVGAGTSWYGLRSSSSSTAACPTGVTLQGAGAAFPNPIISNPWEAGYKAADSNLVNYVASGAGTGITDLIDKQVDFAVTDEPLNATETSQMHAAVGTVLTIPVVGGAVSVVYHAIPSYAGPLNLTVTELAGIYNGTITAWNNPTLIDNNPGLAASSGTIHVFYRSDAAGMSYVLTNLLSDDNAAWAAGPGTSIQPAFPVGLGASGNSAMLKDVGGQTGAIGYTDLMDAESHSLPSALVENYQGSYIAPTVKSTISAVWDIYNASPSSFPQSNASWSGVSFVNAKGTGDYPLATLAYFMVPQNPGAGYTFAAGSAAALVQWIHWVLTAGQSFNSTQFPYVDPPTPLVTQALTSLSSMNYNTAAIPSCT